MIKYPLYVTLDTNIFDSNKLDFSKDSTFGLLVNYIKAKKIKLVLSNIVIKEVEKHVLRASNDVCSQFRELRKDILNVVAEPFLEQLGISPRLLLLDKKQYREKGMTVWREFLENLQPEIMDMSLVDIDSIVNDYFEIKPPFEAGEKKRKEFPDAFIANQIRKRFGVDEVIAIVSNDNGLKKACGNSSNHIFYESLTDLYDAINRQEAEYEEVLQKINSLLVEYISKIRDIVENEDCIEVRGISYDKDGSETGFDYSDVEVKVIEDIKCHVRTIDEITDEISWATLLCTANIEVECSYEDYNNAVWDSETKSYYFLETRKNIEIHSARFGVRIEFNRIEEELRIIPFKVILGGDTLEERFEKNEEDEEYYNETC
ncbi:PIN domain-containing protein [Dorea sp.]